MNLYVFSPDDPFWYLREDEDDTHEVHEVESEHLGHMPIAKGDWAHLSKKVKNFIGHWVSLKKNLLIIFSFNLCLVY